MKITRIFTRSVHFLLFVMFLYLFGFPALKKFQRKSTTFQKETTNHDYQFPVLTVCTSNMANMIGSGWKRANWSPSKVLKRQCPSSSLKEMIRCIDEKTYELHETVNLTKSVPAINKESWTSDITYTHFGKCYTFKPTFSREDG